ncbi:MAG: alkyl hydroperoxide reductase [Deltaproteobacteria bacterium]
MNCQHLLPVLGALSTKRLGQPLAVIGIHSAKFDSERETANVRAAVARLGIEHPVLVDSQMTVWTASGVEAWPTLVIVRPNGRIAGSIAGEVSLAELDRAVGQVMDEARADGTLGSTQLLPPRRHAAQAGVLSYPGKLLAAGDGRIFVSDSGHHRVQLLGHDGRILETIGDGTAGRAEGPFATARLTDPQGLAFDRTRERLYIADGRGQTIWVADLRAGRLSLLAGTGELGSLPLGGPQLARTAALRTPWDLALAGERLYVALAGSHQLGVVDLSHGLAQATIARLSGSGREALEDGPAALSAFAQPSGLALHDGKIYVADSESSAVREVGPDGNAETLIGTGLFDWGDAVGPVRPRMLQHPLAVAAGPEGLYVADSYNHKVKRLSWDGKTLTAVLDRAGGAPLDGPAGLSVEPDGSLLVADTDRGRLLRLRPGAREAEILAVRAAPEVEAKPLPEVTPMTVRSKPARRLPAARVARDAQALRLSLRAPDGYAFSDGAPWSIAFAGPGAPEAISGEATAGSAVTVSAPLPGPPKATTLELRLRAVVCDAVTHAACHPVRERFELPLQPVGQDGPPTPISLPSPAASRATPH